MHAMNMSLPFCKSIDRAFKNRKRYSSECLFGVYTDFTFSFMSLINYWAIQYQG